jgi:hypothetical protein
MDKPQSGIGAALLLIIESLSTRPTSGELLGALIRAERAGYRRALAEACNGIEVAEHVALEEREDFLHEYFGTHDSRPVERWLVDHGEVSPPAGAPAFLRRQAE